MEDVTAELGEEMAWSKFDEEEPRYEGISRTRTRDPP
jgi:hypothetical protein